jgi:hypothetical protein
MALTLPFFTRSTTSREFFAGMPPAVSARAIALPEASASRQPKLPHVHAISAPRET